MIEAIQFNNPYGWNFFPNSARSHLLLRGHMTSNDEAVSRKISERATLQKSMTSEGNSALLPANVDR